MPLWWPTWRNKMPGLVSTKSTLGSGIGRMAVTLDFKGGLPEVMLLLFPFIPSIQWLLLSIGILAKNSLFERIFVSEPNGDDSMEECVHIYGESGGWNDISCMSTMPFVCKKYKSGSTPKPWTTPPPTGYCQEGFTQYRGQCYKMISDPVSNWTDAKQVMSTTYIKVRPLPHALKMTKLLLTDMDWTDGTLHALVDPLPCLLNQCPLV